MASEYLIQTDCACDIECNCIQPSQNMLVETNAYGPNPGGHAWGQARHDQWGTGQPRGASQFLNICILTVWTCIR